MKHVVIYARVSSNTTEQLDSLKAQVSGLTKFVSGHNNWKLVDIHIDIASSKKGSVRPAFHKMIEECKAGLTDIVVVLSTDYKGSAAKCDAEFNWIIKAIEYPDGYKPEDEGKIRELIKEAFIVNLYSELFNHERVKNVSVRFEC